MDGGFDTQGAYRAISANVAAAIPVHDGDEIGGQVQYIHYDGKQKFLAIPNRNDFLLEAAYYSKPAKVQPFLKYEAQKFADTVNLAKDYNRWGGGVNDYVFGQNLKFTGQLQRSLPQHSVNKPSNEFTMQMQVFFF